jgi:CheY-like chemotaxis protein/anti-sigma regulatory factor (Ser/Thr protein kinase)
LAILRRNVELEARLIDDLLDVTRIVRGKIELRPTIVDVHALITSAVDICQSDISAKRMKMTQALGAARCHAHGDAVRLQQIIWNLLRNAVKFTPDGGQITIRSDNDGDMLTISITDTGIGIAPDAMERIFSPFEQAARAITQQFGGLGLGLAISKRLAELHGGTVIAESDGLNRGSTFTICLPTVLAPSVKLDIARPRPGNGNIRQLRILLVEDHEDTRDSLSRLLSRHHSVRDVPGMAAALKAASGETFDLLISDVGLPDGSGLELMRELHDRCDIKGICLSGFGMDEDIARSTEAGFAHHITKPVDFHRLESIIHSLAS